MNFEDVPTWIGSGIAFVVGAAGIVFGALGYREAKRASNRADRANELAQQANDLSEQANAVASRNSALSEEQWFVDWTAEWNSTSSELTLWNKGSDPALSVAVTASGAPDVHFDSGPLGEVEAGTGRSVRVDQVADLRRDYEEAEEDAGRPGRYSALFVVPRTFKVKLKVTVRWKSGLGRPESREFEIKAT